MPTDTLVNLLVGAFVVLVTAGLTVYARRQLQAKDAVIADLRVQIHSLRSALKDRQNQVDRLIEEQAGSTREVATLQGQLRQAQERLRVAMSSPRNVSRTARAADGFASALRQMGVAMKGTMDEIAGIDAESVRQDAHEMLPTAFERIGEE